MGRWSGQRLQVIPAAQLQGVLHGPGSASRGLVCCQALRLTGILIISIWGHVRDSATVSKRSSRAGMFIKLSKRSAANHSPSEGSLGVRQETHSYEMADAAKFISLSAVLSACPKTDI
ncbi:hypothetical protein HaLaN_02192 [Haematococcus lacustris]|uniref:Uncharacterized protein n=1 Tax=Haematococcus lacustris TaxID=44745 RepID=A0A699YHP7_HAELA|nr:hypothetical protein HaLaN_02192 [Haematococcus lacustris]